MQNVVDLNGSDGSTLKGAHQNTAQGVAQCQTKATLKDFVGIFKDKHAMRAILNSAGFSAIFKTSKDYLQPILETFALAWPLLFLLDLNDVKRSGLVIGGVYFFIYLLTSYASRNSDRFSSLNKCRKNLLARIANHG